MKKILLFASLCLVPALTFAQGFQIGIKGGVNLSRLTFGDFVSTGSNANGSPSVNVDGQTFRNNLQASLDSKVGTSFGVYTRFGRNLFIQPEVLYSTRNGDFTVTQNGQTQTQTVKTQAFDVPVMLGIKGGPIRVMAGPMASFRIADNQSLGDAARQYTNGSFSNALSQAYYSYVIGGGIDIGSLGLDVRYQGNLSDIAQIQGNNGQFSQGSRTWQITLAYKIF